MPVRQRSNLLERLRRVKTVDDITQPQVIKNLLWNGPHAIIAWYASLLGYSGWGQGMGDPRVSELAQRRSVRQSARHWWPKTRRWQMPWQHFQPPFWSAAIPPSRTPVPVSDVIHYASPA